MDARNFCLDLECLAKNSVKYDPRFGLQIYLDGRWMKGSGITRETSNEVRSVAPRRKRRKPGEKRRAPAGKMSGILIHQQVMHNLRCLRWFDKTEVNKFCKCSEHTPFGKGFVLPSLRGGPGDLCSRELHHLLTKRRLLYVTGEIGVIVDAHKRVGTFVDGVAISMESEQDLWVLELKTGHRHLSNYILNKHKRQTQAGMRGLQLLLSTENKTTKNERRVVGGLLIYLDSVRDCVRVEEIKWEEPSK